MPTNDATQVDESPQVESTEAVEATSPEPAGTDAAEQIASYRKRQAGAEAARQAAERKLAEMEKELSTYRAQNQTASEQELSELARLQERLQVAEARAAEAEAKAEARILDAKYPNARKELPEVTDEVRLAKFEAMLRDEEPESTTPPRVGSNPQRAQAPVTKSLDDMTSKEIEAYLKTFDPSVMLRQQ